MRLSDHFTLYEATYSSTALKHQIHNLPDEVTYKRMLNTAEGMERVRRALGNVPVKVNSWFRSAKVNGLVGGSATSQHVLGEAVDFIISGKTPREICKILIANKSEIRYDQLILEPTWVHVSFKAGQGRGQELTYVGPRNYKAGIA